MKFQDWYIDIIEELCMVLYGIAAGEKDDNFFSSVFAEEGIEEKDALVGLADDICL
jgi:hypothetical protein